MCSVLAKSVQVEINLSSSTVLSTVAMSICDGLHLWGALPSGEAYCLQTAGGGGGEGLVAEPRPSHSTRLQPRAL